MRMRRVTWPKVGWSQITTYLVIWNPRPHTAYSLYNIYGAAVMIKGSLLMSLPIWRNAHAPRHVTQVGHK